MLERTYAVIRERVWTKRTGIYLYASPRMGKTTCAEAVQALLAVEFPNICILRIDARRSGRPSESHMFRLILDGVNHALSRRTDVNLLFHNVNSAIMVQLAAHGGAHCVLIIDELNRSRDK